MDGIIVINKKTGLSSHDCVYAVRRIYKTKKVGHSGTLDVEASGVLVLGVNKGTKLLQYLNQEDKTYNFDVCFGIETDTLDHVGNIVRKNPVQSLDNFDTILKSFIGEYHQVPPDYSAVKVNGKKLYEYARKNEAVPKVEARALKIYDLARLSEIVINDDSTAEVKLNVRASKGFYVRQFVKDLAEKFNTVAHTTSIHRTQAGDYTIDQSYDLEAIKEDLPTLISLSNALPSMPSMTVSQTLIDKIKHGQKIDLDTDAPLIKLVNQDDALLAIYEKRETDYKPKNVFM